MTWREKYRQDSDLVESIITALRADLDEAEMRVKHLECALEKIRDCAFVITLPDRMDAVRAIARETLATTEDSSAVGATDKDSLMVGEPVPGEESDEISCVS